MSATSARIGEEYFNAGVRAARQAAGFGGLKQLYDRHYAAFGYPADQLKPATIGALCDRINWQSSLDALMRAVEIDPKEIEWQRWTALVLEELGQIDDALLVRRTIASLDPDSLENKFALGRLLECKGEPVHEYYAQVLTDSSDYLLALARAAALRGRTVVQPESLENDLALGRMLEHKGAPVGESGPQVLTGESDYLLALARTVALSAPTAIRPNSIENNGVLRGMLERKGEPVARRACSHRQQRLPSCSCARRNIVRSDCVGACNAAWFEGPYPRRTHPFAGERCAAFGDGVHRHRRAR